MTIIKTIADAICILAIVVVGGFMVGHHQNYNNMSFTEKAATQAVCAISTDLSTPEQAACMIYKNL